MPQIAGWDAGRGPVSASDRVADVLGLPADYGACTATDRVVQTTEQLDGRDFQSLGRYEISAGFCTPRHHSVIGYSTATDPGVGSRNPRAPFVHHTLAISQLVVDVIDRQASEEVDIFRLESEPRCWLTTPCSPSGLITRPLLASCPERVCDGRITRELNRVAEQLAGADLTFAQIETTLQRCLRFATHCYEMYLAAPPKLRRQMNQAVFEKFFVDEEGVLEAQLNGPFQVFLNPHLLVETENELEGGARPGEASIDPTHRNNEWTDGTPTWLRDGR